MAPDSTRERILAATLYVFAERGFDSARTRNTTERAGPNLGVIKCYFREGAPLKRRRRARLRRAAAEGPVAPIPVAPGRAATRGAAEAPRNAILRLSVGRRPRHPASFPLTVFWFPG